MFPLPTSVATMGTNGFIHQLSNLGGAPFAPNWIVDVRDVARGNVLALGALPFPASVWIRRFIINGTTYPWSKVAYLKKPEPEVKNTLEKIPVLPGVLSNLDTTRR